MPHNSLSSLMIVVVEDHDDSPRALGLFLGQAGANVVLASNAVEAIDAIKNKRPSLVLSDIQLPGCDGFQLLRDIRALGSNAGGSVPVIAISGFLNQEDRTRILSAGFQGFLPKPFSPETLLETISTVLAD
jgi:CheY-like chemotaxis protein